VIAAITITNIMKEIGGAGTTTMQRGGERQTFQAAPATNLIVHMMSIAEGDQATGRPELSLHRGSGPSIMIRAEGVMKAGGVRPEIEEAIIRVIPQPATIMVIRSLVVKKMRGMRGIIEEGVRAVRMVVWAAGASVKVWKAA
jgi:hypothetical protein